tara:strand:+ start:22962 stop:23699 length:738 start_codon:yes stop_codon:yes gene_type:complete
MADKKITESYNSSFCIIIPMYNEQDNVNLCVKTICSFIEEINNKCELLVIDDGSEDETAKRLQELKKIYKNFTVKTHQKNLGYGSANQTGIQYAYKENYEYVLFMDSDLTQDTKYIFDFIELMNNNVDFIKATRYTNSGGAQGVPLFRKIISQIGNLVAKIFLNLPLTDYTNGFRAIKTKLVFNIKHEENGFAYLIEEVNKISKKTNSFGEVPYILKVRANSHSKSKFSYSLDVYLSYLKWVFKK